MNTELETEFREFLAESFKAHGLERSVSDIIAQLYLEPDEISMDELAKKTGYSLASISNKIHLLEHTGIIHRTRKSGSKKTYVYMEKDMMANFKTMLITKQELMIQTAKERLPNMIAKCKPKSREGQRKLDLIKNYHQQLIDMEQLMKTFIEIINTKQKEASR